MDDLIKKSKLKKVKRTKFGSNGTMKTIVKPFCKYFHFFMGLPDPWDFLFMMYYLLTGIMGMGLIGVIPFIYLGLFPGISEPSLLLYILITWFFPNVICIILLRLDLIPIDGCD